jgi:tRNA dimethylallyltransferase
VTVFLLGGPTAAGKSSLAIELAARHGAVVVSADAMTVYRGLDVGTAKPTAEERARVLHYGIDIVEPDEDFSVADFVALVERVRAQHDRVVVAGGTPFYLRALVQPLARLPPADPVLRAELEALPDLHGALAAVDPASAARLHPNDRVRVVRALEVHRLTGKSLTALHQEGADRPPLHDGMAWLDREGLRPRIAARLRQMIDQGYLEELQSALERGVPREARPLRSFSYRHLLDHIDGTVSLEEALRRTERDTWRLARKQRTWARGMGWPPIGPAEARQAAALCFETSLQGEGTAPR